MGIISWIKDKYYDISFQKAKTLIAEGDTDEAIRVLESILEKHPNAPQTLLEVYHSMILRGNKSYVSQVARLYGMHEELKDDCLNFVKHSKILNASLYIYYCQSLYCKGASEFQSYFLNASVEYVETFIQLNSLSSLSANTVLLTALSSALFVKAELYYEQKSLEKSKRLCVLIAPYLFNPQFFELYVKVRFDIIIGKEVTKESLFELDTVLDYSQKRISLKAKSTLFVKGIELAKKMYDDKNYVLSLLISQRFVDLYFEAKEIYSKSALRLYESSSKSISLIDVPVFYSCLGEGLEFISALEPFIPYSTYREKYIVTVEKELVALVKTDCSLAKQLLCRAWGFVQSDKFLKAVFSVGTEASKREFVKMIIDSDGMLSSKENLAFFVEELIKMDFSEFIVSSLEQLLDKGKDVCYQYEQQILIMARHAVANSRDRVEIVKRAFKRVRTNKLYSVAIAYLNDYIDTNHYDWKFALAIAEMLVGKQGMAQVLIAKVLIDESLKSRNDVVKEEKLRNALSFNKVHDPIFDNNAYATLLPRIERGIIKLAKKIYNSDMSRAIELLYLLRDNGLSWFDAYGKLYLESIQKEKETEKLATQIYSILTEGHGLKASVQDELWAKFVCVKISICSKVDDVAIEELKALLELVDSQCMSKNKLECKKNIVEKLCSHLIVIAKAEEAKQLYDEAIEDYKYILELSSCYNEAKERLFICKLKKGKDILSEDKEQISNLLSSNKDKPYQRDLAFRWCLYLISEGNMEEVERINVNILNSDSEISQICQDKKIASCLEKLNILNKQILKLNNSELLPEEAVAFGQSLSEKIGEIELITKVSVQKANAIKESIRLYAIEEFYNRGDALKSLNGLKVQDSTYLSNPIALRNMAIMSLVATENGQLSNSNYKELLAMWATAIYQQSIFVKSLDFTSWDDQYTFSLNSALGCLGMMSDEELPDNVNYDTNFDDKKNVSILDVQKALISRMETAICDNSEYLLFFSSQLEAMDMLASQELEYNCVLVAPYLASISRAYKKNIEKALVHEASLYNENWENILKIGVRYGLNDGDFNSYSSALEILKEATLAIKSKCNLVWAYDQIVHLKKFAGLYNDIVSTVADCMNNDIAKETNFRTFYLYYKKPVQTINDDVLSFTFSNYINLQAVKALNEKTETLAKVSPLLFQLYDFCKCNPHLKRNVDNIVEALIHNYITDGDSANLMELDRILSSTREFDSLVVKALKGGDGVSEDMMILLFSSNEQRFSQLKYRIEGKSLVIRRQFSDTYAKISDMKIQLELSEIVTGVNNDTITKCNALQKVYNLYKQDKNNVRVCQNLATLVPMCVMEYIIADKRGKLTVKTLLNDLKRDMSMTFRANNSEIGQAYDMLWNQLPYSAKSAITNSPWTLNEQGEKLKNGLDYLKALR